MAEVWRKPVWCCQHSLWHASAINDGDGDPDDDDLAQFFPCLSTYRPVQKEVLSSATSNMQKYE